ncbi:MAG TPA: TIR domain-containing protein [Sphingomicrobium sp.]|nr:TIR domain-containing protein [Sphingomicrobium sp.]
MVGWGKYVSATDIFLSYARQDRPVARLFAEALTEEGFSVWWDASLHSGETFDEVIEQRLRDATAVVVLWSPRSVASRWVRAEATLADRRNKLAPAIIEPCDRPIIFELTHAAELAGWTGDRSDIRWRDFVGDLRRLVDAAGAATAPEPPAPAKPARIEALARAPQMPIRQPLRPGSDEVIVAERRGANAAPAGSAADSQSDVHCLSIEEGELAGEVITIESSGIRIGRAAPADVVIPHKSVSREHCIVGLANDELLVTDLNSTNGTYIDEVRIDRATILPVGSVLRLGQVSLTHSIVARSEAEAPREPRLAASR